MKRLSIIALMLMALSFGMCFTPKPAPPPPSQSIVLDQQEEAESLKVALEFKLEQSAMEASIPAAKPKRQLIVPTSLDPVYSRDVPE